MEKCLREQLFTTSLISSFHPLNITSRLLVLRRAVNCRGSVVFVECQRQGRQSASSQPALHGLNGPVQQIVQGWREHVPADTRQQTHTGALSEHKLAMCLTYHTELFYEIVLLNIQNYAIILINFISKFKKVGNEHL